jgi:hypothetical protein
MRIFARLFLLIIYGLVSTGAIWLIGGGPAGEGSFLPVIIICSWAIPIARLIWPTGAGGIVSSIIYYIFLLILATRIARLTENRFPLATWIIHFLGVAVALLIIKKNFENPPIMPLWLIGLASCSLVLLYLWIDWHLARADLQKKGSVASNLEG